MEKKAITLFVILFMLMATTGFLSMSPSAEAVGPVKWHMHVDQQGDSGLDLVFNQVANHAGPYDAALDVADDTVDAMIAEWETAALGADTDVSGTWTFSLDMWEDDDVIEGAVYAKVYADTTLLNVTPDETLTDIANDNISGGTTVAWTSALPHPTIVSTGEQIIVEYWFDATAGGSLAGGLPYSEFVVDGSDTGGSEGDMGPGDDSITNDFDDGSGDVMDVRWTYDISAGSSDINVTYDVDSWDAGDDNMLLQWSNDNSTWNDLTPSSSTVDQDTVAAAVTSKTPSYVHIESMTASASGTLSSLGFYMTSTGTGSSFVRLALYADASGVPAGAAPLAETDLLNINGLGPGWIDIPTNETPAISSSTQYWIASSMSSGLYYDINRSDNSGSLYYKSATFPALPSDAGAWSSGSDSYLRATRMSYGADGIAAGSTDVDATVDLSDESITFDSTFYLRAYVPDNGGSTVQTAEIDQLYIDTGIFGGAIASDEFVVDGSDTGGSEGDMGPGDDSITNDFDDGSGDVMDVRWTYDISAGSSDINVTYDVDSWDAGDDNLKLQWSNDNSTWSNLTPSSSTVDQDSIDSAITSGGPSYVHIEAMTASSSGTLSSLGFYLSAVGSSDTYVRLALYADASGVPAGAAPLAETDLLNVNGLGPGWIDIPTNETPTISSSTQYWISSSMSQMLGLSLNRSGNTPLYYKSSTFPALPSDAGAWSSGSASYSRTTRMSYGTDGIAAGSTDATATVDLSDESITFDSTFYLRAYVPDNGGSTVQTAEIDQLYIDIGIIGGGITYQLHLGYDSTGLGMDSWVQIPLAAPDTFEEVHMGTRWTLFSLSVFNTTSNLSASDIFALVTADGGTPQIMTWWEPGVGYHSYTGTTGDFEVKVGHAYWVYLDDGGSATDIEVQGLNRTDYEAWDLVNGDGPGGDGTADGKLTVPLVTGEYNLLGWFNDTTVPVSTFITTINDGYAAGTRGLVAYWDNTLGEYGNVAVQLSGGFTSQSWNVAPETGYWSGINTATSVTY